MSLSPDRPDFGEGAFGAGYFGGPVLVLVETPTGSAAPIAIADYSASRRSRTTVRDTINGDLVVVQQAPAPRSGTLRLIFADAVQAHRALGLHSTTETITLTSTARPEVSMRYVVAEGDLRIERDSANSAAWFISVPFQEVNA